MAEPKTITKEEFERVLNDFRGHKEKAGEATGRAGSTVSQAVDAYALDKKAFGFVAALSKKEQTQIESTMRALIRYADYAGFFDSVDAFDDIISQMHVIVERNGSGVPKPADQAASDVVTNLVQPH